MKDSSAVAATDEEQELAALIPRPRLLPGEDKAQYDALRDALAMNFCPETAHGMVLVANLVDIEWEGRRYRHLRDDLLRARARDLAEEAFDEGGAFALEPSEKAKKLAAELVGADEKARNLAMQTLSRKGADLDQLFARAYALESRALGPIERHIAELEERRRRLVDDLDRLRASHAIVVSDRGGGARDDD